jgi:hypothetical protein
LSFLLFIKTASTQWEILGGNYTKNGHITVEFPPSFALSPMSEAWSWDNHLVNLTCRAESIPNATISWFLNGRNLENDYNIRMNAFNGESTITVFIIFSLFFWGGGETGGLK